MLLELIKLNVVFKMRFFKNNLYIGQYKFVNILFLVCITRFFHSHSLLA